MKNRYLFIKGLRVAENTVFGVSKGQKTYWHNGKEYAYSSGQQVKRSLMDYFLQTLGEDRAEIEFSHVLKKGKKSQGTAISSCNPLYADQLIGGYMQANTRKAEGSQSEGEEAEKMVIKRRSPLSISALRPLHPTLTTVFEDALTFDRSAEPSLHKVRIYEEAGKEAGKSRQIEIVGDRLNKWLEENQDPLMRWWLKAEKKTTGLFAFDIAIDLDKLFSLSIQQIEPEISLTTISLLKENGWIEKNGYLICPAPKRQEIINALAEAIVNWRITSNQSRSYSPQETIALAIGHNASMVSAAIRAELIDDIEFDKAIPRIDQSIKDVSVFVHPSAKGFVKGLETDNEALLKAEKHIKTALMAYNFEG